MNEEKNSVKFVADGSLELNEEMRRSNEVHLVPFKIYVDEEEQPSSGTFSEINEFIRKMKRSFRPVRTVCPSPAEYYEAYGETGDVFVITISSELSGSYNSAQLAKEMRLSEDPNRHIHIFDSKSASVGETQVYMKIKDFLSRGFSYEEIIEGTERFISEMKTFFLLNSLDNLMKNGRISMVSGLLGSVLHFSPIMEGKNGIIHLYENIRGRKKALKRLVEAVGENVSRMEERIVTISHVNASDVAEMMAEQIRKLYSFKDVMVFRTGDLSSVYADEGGIILTY